MNSLVKMATAGAVLVGTAIALSGPVAALPLGGAAKQTADVARTMQRPDVIQVRNSGRAAAAAMIGIIGGIVASQALAPRYYYYGPPAYYYPSPPVVYYPPPAPRVYYPPPAPTVYYYNDPAIAYCIRRFKSYDIYSRTYLGYDHRRHYCGP